MATLTLDRVSKSFNHHFALTNLSLHVADGEFVSLLGPSGSGKSATLKLVCGLEQADSGTILIDERSVDHLQPQERGVAMVVQKNALHPRMTVEQHMIFSLKESQLPAAEQAAQIAIVADALGIHGLLDRYIQDLSDGQQQRVALGCTLVRRAHLFLMDEPLSNLDAKLRIQMRSALRRLNERFPMTALYVTHDQAEAMILSDKIAILDGGVLQQYGPPHQVYEQPVNSFVAGFVGSYPMTFIEGVFRGGVDSSIATRSGVIPLAPRQHNALHRNLSSDTVLIGVRPEQARVSLRPIEGALPGTTSVVEQLGCDTLVDIAVASAQVRVRTKPTFRCRVGQEVWVVLPLESLYLFDSTTGITLVFPHTEDDSSASKVSKAVV